jgi:hypothetical protein
LTRHRFSLSSRRRFFNALRALAANRPFSAPLGPRIAIVSDGFRPALRRRGVVKYAPIRANFSGADGRPSAPDFF